MSGDSTDSGGNKSRSRTKSSAHNVESKKDGSIGNDTRIKNQSSGRHKEGRASKSTERTEDTGKATQEKETEVDQAEVNDERL